MLMQNFKSAADLGITEPQLSALRKTLVLLETGKLEHRLLPDDIGLRGEGKEFSGHFNMHVWTRADDCGTIACIGGTAELIGKTLFPFDGRSDALSHLFEPRSIDLHLWKHITPSQAATALRSYLTTGDARWDLAVA